MEKVLLKEFKNGNKLWGTKTFCSKCCGTGKVIWSYADHLCFDCDGKGWYFVEEREYTPENLAKREAALKKKAEKEAAERAKDAEERAAREAVWKAEQEAYEAARRGHFFGEIGEKIEIPVTYKGCFSFDTMYGITTVYKFDTDDGAHLIWKTSADLGGNTFYVVEGDRITIRATIKNHKGWSGIDQTELTRLKVVSADCMKRKLTDAELAEAEEKRRNTADELDYAIWLRGLYMRKTNEEVSE